MLILQPYIIAILTYNYTFFLHSYMLFFGSVANYIFYTIFRLLVKHLCNPSLLFLAILFSCLCLTIT